MRTTAKLFSVTVATAALALAACDGDNDQPTTGAGDTGATDATRNTGTTATSQEINALEAVAQAPTVPPSQTLSHDQFQAILDSIRPPSSEELIARDLNAINPSWRASAGDIQHFVVTACQTSVSGAVDFLAGRFQGAIFTTVPAFNRAIALVPVSCSPVRPRAMDELSSGVMSFVIDNEFRRGIEKPSYTGTFNLPTEKEQSVCNALEVGKPVAEWAIDEIIERASRGRATGGAALGLVLEAAVTACPSWIVQLR